MENIDLSLNLETQGYVQGAQQAAAATAQLASAYAGLERQQTLLEKAMKSVTPGRVMVAAFGGAVASAAAFEQSLGGMQATASAAGQSMKRLQTGMSELARQFPVGNRGAMEIVGTLQTMGIQSTKQVNTINLLAKSFVNLGAATGTNASVIGRQMVQLNRAFGSSDGNVKRFKAMSDSLTTVTAKIGGSSSEILAFSKNIAPMARSAGIGQTAVMGISAAFSKMGEDGYAASNAMNKMLTDLNRSVRDGSSEMGTYANIVGKTREEFEALFKADPTKALGELTSALGGGGAGSERNLERIGLDGVRTARVLQGLSQQGGIQAAADVAVGAYGNGSTERAGREAMDGLTDEFSKLRASAEQVSEALGRPFLSAITAVVRVAGAPVRGAASVLDRAPVQEFLREGVPLIVGGLTAWLGARAISGIGITASATRQMTTQSGIARSFREGQLRGQNGPGIYGPMQAAVEEGRVSEEGGFIDRAWLRTMDIGEGFGQARARERGEDVMDRYRELTQNSVGVLSPQFNRQALAQATAPERPMGDRAKDFAKAIPATVATAGVGLRDLYNRVMRDPVMQMSGEGAGDPTKRAGLSGLRVQRMGAPLPRGAEGPLAPAITDFGKMTDQLKELKAQTEPLPDKIKAMASVLGDFGRKTVDEASVVKAGSDLVGGSIQQIGAGFKGLGGALNAARIPQAIGGLMSKLVDPVALGIGVVGAVGTNIMSNRADDKAKTEEFLNSSITGTADAYQDAMGLATQTTQTFAEQIESANKALQRQVSTMTEARRVTESDIAYAKATKKDVVNDFGDASNESVAEQIRSALGASNDPRMNQAVKVDLLRQGRSERDVEDIMARATNGDQTNFDDLFAGVGKGSGNGKMDNFRRAFLGQQGFEKNTWSSAAGIAAGGGVVQVGTMLADWAGFTDRRTGQGSNAAKISDDQESALTAALEGLRQGSARNEDQYGAEYAAQEQARAANRIYESAAKTGNSDLIAMTSKRLTEAIGEGGEKDSRAISRTEAKEAGGFIQAFRDLDKSFARQSKGIDLDPTNGTVGLTAKLTDSAITKATDNIELFSTALSNRTSDVDTALNKTTQEFLKTPGDTAKFRAAVNEIMESGRDAGMSLTEVGNAALTTVKALGDATSDASRLASAVYEKTSQQIDRQASTVGTAATIQARLVNSQNLMNSADNTEEGQARYEQGSQEQYETLEAAKNVLKQRLAAERAFQIQSGRARTDYNLQVEYAEADFQKNLLRTEEDYQTQRARANRDFNLQVQQGQEDFNTSRMRAQRDFNKSIRRMNEDAAKSMYDPYKRMQVQATSDVGTLMVNLREQNEAMQRQAQNLDRLRAMGVNNNTIDQLGLGKSENAQQASRIVADLESGGDAQALNGLIAARMSSAAVLQMDESNKEIQRSREDFNQNMADQEKDYKKSIARSRKAFNQSMADMAADYMKALARNEADFRQSLARQYAAFTLQLKRQREDIEESQREIVGSYEQLQSAVFDVMQGKAVNFSTLMTDTINGVVNAANNAAGQVAGLTGQQAPSGTAPDLGGNTPGNPVVGQAGGLKTYSAASIGRGNTTSLIDDVAGDSHAKVTITSVKRNKNGKSYHDKWQAVDYGGDPKEMLKLAKYLRGQVQKGTIKLSELIHWSPIDGQKYFVHDNQIRNVYSAKTWADHKDHVHVAMDPARAKQMLAEYNKESTAEKKARMDGAGGGHQMAKGGIVSGETRAIIGEAGYAEAVIPLNTSGVGVLARAMTQYMSGPDLTKMMTAGRGDRVVYNGGQTFIEDHSTNIEGATFEIKADDPNAMMRALQAKARAANLTSAPQRKRT